MPESPRTISLFKRAIGTFSIDSKKEPPSIIQANQTVLMGGWVSKMKEMRKRNMVNREEYSAQGQLLGEKINFRTRKSNFL